MKARIKKLIEKGFLHIFGANVLNQIIGFASSIFLVRLLTKEEFGLYSYAQNILMFFMLFNGLGVTAGMLQYGSETTDKSRRNAIFNYGIRVGIFFNIIVCILILLYSTFLPLKIDNAKYILASMFLLPLLMFVVQSIQIYFRVSLENQKFSFITTFNTFLLFAFSVIGAYLFQVIGIVGFRYIAFTITIIVGFVLIRNVLSTILSSSKLAKEVKKSFLKFSVVSSFNNAISQLLYIIDIFIIGVILADEVIIASYKSATLIPFALNFIPISIMVFVYPYFAKNNNNKSWVKSNYIKLTKYLFVINLLISLFLLMFAPLIMKIVFGDEYLDSVGIFRILAFGYLIAGTFRIPAGNILVMLKKVKFGFYLSIITGVLNIVLDLILIRLYGSTGAAIATVSVFVFTSMISVSYLFYKLK